MRFLMELGITANYKGYWYLLTALRLLTLEQLHTIRVTGDLYPRIARQHGVSAQSVERSIRTAIEACWGCGNRELLRRLCPGSHRPTNATFIAALVVTLYISGRDDPSASL